MRALGIILAGGSGKGLGSLTSIRATSAMPVGSSYRAIDFPLSNMSNSGVSKVAVITQYNSRSLHDHLSSAKWWNFGRKHGGLFIFTPYLSNENSYWFRGTADSIYQNISFLRRSNEPYVVISSGDCIYKTDYNALIESHITKNADITIMCKDMEGEDLTQYGVMNLNSDNRVLEFEEKPMEPNSSIASLGVYVMGRTLLIKLLETIQSESRYDFVKDIIIRYRKMLKIHAHFFDGYWKSISSIQSYYDINMDFLKEDIRAKFTREYPYISTKPKDEPPAKYNYSAKVSNSLFGSGSIINGNVENSVLFRKVVVSEHSIVKNSIIMEGVYISDGCYIENAIIDKEVVITDGKEIIGEIGNPAVISEKVV